MKNKYKNDIVIEVIILFYDGEEDEIKIILRFLKGWNMIFFKKNSGFFLFFYKF